MIIGYGLSGRASHLDGRLVDLVKGLDMPSRPELNDLDDHRDELEHEYTPWRLSCQLRRTSAGDGTLTDGPRHTLQSNQLVAPVVPALPLFGEARGGVLAVE